METQKHIEMLNAVADVVNRREPSAHQPVHDSLGIACPVEYPGRYFLHGNIGMVYRVISYCMRHEDRVWYIRYVNMNSQISTIEYLDTVGYFDGNLENGHKRFVEIHDVAVISGNPADRLPAALPEAPQPQGMKDIPTPQAIVASMARPNDAPLGHTVTRPVREGKMED